LRAIRDRPDMTAVLQRVAWPVLFSFGDADPITPVEDAENMMRALPAVPAELSVIAGAAHLPNLERPEQFKRSLFTFLERYC
jgi:3-oxoadipate enol-lactonase